MMRSLYSAVSGLKSHQTKMDVIGNNIANVNTVAFKSSSVTFSDVMYQTTSMASSPNAATGVGGINAKQIGLGSTMATSKVSISQAGATQTTGSALDCKINGKSFFVVSDGKSNFFTRVGSFTFDAAGNLVMNSTGYNVMGWQVDPATGDIKKDTVSALRIMSAENMISNPEATTDAYVSGVLDSNSTAVKTDSGYSMNLNFYDALGYQYTAKFKATEGNTAGEYKISLTDILDSNSKSIFGNNGIDTYVFGPVRTYINKLKDETINPAIKEYIDNYDDSILQDIETALKYLHLDFLTVKNDEIWWNVKKMNDLISKLTGDVDVELKSVDDVLNDDELKVVKPKK